MWLSCETFRKVKNVKKKNSNKKKFFHTSCTVLKNVLKNEDEDDGLTVAVPLRFVSSRTRRKCEIVCVWLACYSENDKKRWKFFFVKLLPIILTLNEVYEVFCMKKKRAD